MGKHRKYTPRVESWRGFPISPELWLWLTCEETISHLYFRSTRRCPSTPKHHHKLCRQNIALDTNGLTLDTITVPRRQTPTGHNLPVSTRHFTRPSDLVAPPSLCPHTPSVHAFHASLASHWLSFTIQTYLRKQVWKQVLSHCFVVTFRPSTVRFRLPLTPPQGIEMPPKSVQYREIGTMEAVVDVPKLNKSASRWRKADLDLLGVDYDHEPCVDIRI